MRLNVYLNQNEVKHTYECDAYDLMYGTVEDILDILDGVTGKGNDDGEMVRAIVANRDKLNALILDVFPDMTDEDLRNIKVKELVPFFIELFDFVRKSIKGGASKN